MGLEALTPEEKAQFYAALQAEMGGGDVCDCGSKFEAVASVLDQVVAKLDAIDERASALEKTVMEDMIGGIKKLYGENVRSEGITGLKAKYGSMFDPHMDAFKEMYGDQDLYGSLYDEIERMRGTDGYSDEAGDSRIKQIADTFRGKVEKIRGAPKVEAVKVEAGPVPASGEEDPMKAIVDRVKSLKKGKNRNMDFMPGSEG